MQLYKGLTIEEVIERQDELFRRVPVILEKWARENDCYPNCVAKVERDRGRLIVGWRRTNADEGAGLVAALDHRAVWENPAGEMIEISPRVRIIKNRMQIVSEEYIYRTRLKNG